MAYSGTRLINQHFLGSPAGILKMTELLFGAGAWGPLASAAWDRSSALIFSFGPHLFYFWVTAGTWALVLLTFLLRLFQFTRIPSTEVEKKATNAPRFGDLLMNWVIGILYFIAIVVFGVYSFSPTHGANSAQSGSFGSVLFADSVAIAASRSRAVFMIIMAVFAFVAHAIHSLSLLLCLAMGTDRWKQERRWLWQSPEQSAPNTRQGLQQEPVYANPTAHAPGGPVLTGMPHASNIQTHAKTGTYYEEANNPQAQQSDSVA